VIAQVTSEASRRSASTGSWPKYLFNPTLLQAGPTDDSGVDINIRANDPGVVDELGTKAEAYVSLPGAASPLSTCSSRA
jgi:hypothetical protein